MIKKIILIVSFQVSPLLDNRRCSDPNELVNKPAARAFLSLAAPFSGDGGPRMTRAGQKSEENIFRSTGRSLLSICNRLSNSQTRRSDRITRRFCCGVKEEALALALTTILPFCFSTKSRGLSSFLPPDSKYKYIYLSVRGRMEEKRCLILLAASWSQAAVSERWMMFSFSSLSSFIIPPPTRGSRNHRKLIPLSASRAPAYEMQHTCHFHVPAAEAA